MSDADAVPLLTMRFDRSNYEALRQSAEAETGLLPYNEVARRGMRFLWSWQWAWRFRQPSVAGGPGVRR